MENRLASAKADVASITTTISDLNNSSSELTQMETTTKQTFTFNELPAGSEVGGNEKGKDGVITMGITSELMLFTRLLMDSRFSQKGQLHKLEDLMQKFQLIKDNILLILTQS